ncbi:MULTISPECIES: hypothetical protein [Alphaproteobacteria]|uniref:Uncharacterized protein n=2 Tax=Alphaproteobacteria TaxID=28211 RepID=A0A512HGB9_9HYPH|nr:MULTISPECIES: hypothetical protein [Alphaproteobacteria]GEO84499.1 hypothetical protein RNA01_14310 [Ciceribacter naphthalenivorans]GLR22462.1 hypothetical protein GCM10007920_22490 [Ciceribacter naphthalenivorans]GLT05318.1 hypothetical protein GCM10007926_22490 [Sphingomonas psychrolutea]
MLSRSKLSRRDRLLRAVSVGLAVAVIGASPALALSDIRQLPASSQDPAAPEDKEKLDTRPDTGLTGIPDPDPLIRKPGDNPPPASTTSDSDEQPPEVIYDLSKAPEPVRRMRELLIEAAASGDVERMRPLLNPGPDQTQIALGTSDADPVAALKQLSGDEDGVEVLAILIDILSTGFVHLDAGTPDEVYVWPYFAERPLALLTPPEKVELLRIVTAGDVAEMQDLGNYNFFRLGITPDGRWKFFTSGD